MLPLLKNKHYFLLYLFATGIGDGLFFIGVGKLLSTKINFVLGISFMFILNEVSKLLFQFIFSTFESRFSMKKAILFSELFQSTFLIAIVIFGFNIYSIYILLSSLVVLNFFDALSKIAEFNLTLKIFDIDERKKYNSLITTINQSSKIVGFIIGGLILKKNFYSLLFLFNALSFLISAGFAIFIKMVDNEIEITSSWKELIKKENRSIILYTFLIATNTVILSSNSMLGFTLSTTNTRETIIYQISNALGSSIATFILSFKIFKIHKRVSENSLVIFGLFFQGVLFLLFNLSSEISKVIIFILISSVSFFNLSLYITKLQDYADLKFKSKVYSLRQLNRAIFNACGVLVLTILSSKLDISYQNVVSIFCFIFCLINFLLIRKDIISYIPREK